MDRREIKYSLHINNIRYSSIGHRLSDVTIKKNIVGGVFLTSTMDPLENPANFESTDDASSPESEHPSGSSVNSKSSWHDWDVAEIYSNERIRTRGAIGPIHQETKCAHIFAVEVLSESIVFVNSENTVINGKVATFLFGSVFVEAEQVFVLLNFMPEESIKSIGT